MVQLVDPIHELIVLLALVAIYGALATVVWVSLCGRSYSAIKKLNAAVAERHGAVYSLQGVIEGSEPCACCIAPDLEATLKALVAERRISKRLANRLRRIAPVFHRGRWSVYPSNSYWEHRFERLKSLSQ
ncbi:MAG TPA: hypothetical protein VIM48_04525 [Chthoniobacterales bacterium]